MNDELMEMVCWLSQQVQELSKEHNCYITMCSVNGENSSADIKAEGSSEFISIFNGEKL